MKSSAARSDISRTLPDGVNTLKRYPSDAKDVGDLPEQRHRDRREQTSRRRAPASSPRARRSAACRFARSIGLIQPLSSVRDFHPDNLLLAQARRPGRR